VKKLKLDLDQIQVVSFAAETAGRGGGTVHAQATPILACAPSGGGSCDSCFPNYCLPQPVSKDVC
jgi:hypothetical protein